MASEGIPPIPGPTLPSISDLPLAAAIPHRVPPRPEPLDTPVLNRELYTEWGYPVGIPDRLMAPDPTGLYEQLLVEDQERATLQLCAAGRMVVGWFSPMHKPPTGRRGSLRSWPSTTSLNGRRFAVERPGAFIVDPARNKAYLPGSRMIALVSGGDDGINRANPSDVLERLDSLRQSQDLLIGSFSSAMIGDDILVSVNFDPEAHRDGDTFRRYSLAARPPYNAAMDKDPARDYLVGTFVDPIGPEAMGWYVASVCGPDVQQLLKAWWKKPRDSAERAEARKNIFSVLAASAWGPHRSATLARMRVGLREQLDIDGAGNVDSLEHWYVHLAREEAEAPNQPGRVLLTGPNRLLVDLGLDQERSVGRAYRLSFAGARLPIKPGRPQRVSPSRFQRCMCSQRQRPSRSIRRPVAESRNPISSRSSTGRSRRRRRLRWTPMAVAG